MVYIRKREANEEKIMEKITGGESFGLDTKVRGFTIVDRN